MAEEIKTVKKTKKSRKSVAHALIFVSCTMNNTIVTITDLEGNALIQSSAGSAGFKNTRKSTPYAAQVASEKAMKQADAFGIKQVNIFIKGFGIGRDQSLRGISSSGVEILSIKDISSVSHGQIRKKKTRRV